MSSGWLPLRVCFSFFFFFVLNMIYLLTADGNQKRSIQEEITRFKVDIGGHDEEIEKMKKAGKQIEAEAKEIDEKAVSVVFFHLLSDLRVVLITCLMFRIRSRLGLMMRRKLKRIKLGCSRG